MDAFLKKTGQIPKAAQTSSLSNSLTTPLLSENSTVTAFYAQLSEREKITHTIAIEKLGSSYDVTRTHGYLKWLKNM